MSLSPIPRPLALRVAAAFLACLWAASTHAASVTWTNSGGGSWSNANNWSGGAIPAAADAAYITNLGVTVNYDAPMATSITNLSLASVGAVTNTLNINTNGFRIITAQSPVFIGAKGVINVNTGGVMVVGGSGTYDIAGSGATVGTLNINGGTFSNISSASYMFVGSAGAGVINLYDGSFVDTVWTRGAFAYNSSFNIYGGTYISPRLGWGRSPNTSNAINLVNGAMIVGGNGISLGGGNDYFNISGGVVTNGGAFSVGAGASGNTMTTGFVVQTGGSFNQSAGGPVILGYDTAGSGTERAYGQYLLGGGTMSNAGGLYLGSSRYGLQMAQGSLVITGGTWHQLGAVELGSYSADGNYSNAAVGRIDISGGAFLDRGNSLIMGKILGSTGTVNIAGGIFAVTNSAGNALLNVGPVGQGTLIFSNGTSYVDSLVATGGTHSVVNFVGGTLNSRGTVISNAALFTVGDGTTAATFNLVGGTHSFGNGVLVTNSAALNIANSSATVNGSVAINGGALNIQNGTGVFTNGGVTVNGSTALVQNGAATWSGPLTINSGSYVSKSGTNTFNSNVVVAAGASLSADSASVATIQGSYANNGISAFSNGVTVGVGGVLNVNTGGLVIAGVSGSSYLSGNANTRGILNLNGGVFTNTGQVIYLGQGGQGEVNVYDGALVDTVRIRMGVTSSGFLNIFGGSVQTPQLSVGRTLGTSNVVNLSGGLLKAGTIELGAYGAGYMNMSGGTVTNTGVLTLGTATDGGTTTGIVVQTAGNWVQTSAGDIRLGYDQVATNILGYGLYTLGGGTMANAGNLYLGSGRFVPGQGKGFMVVTGGVWNQTGNIVEVGSYSAGAALGSIGRLDLLGGSFNANGVSETVWIGRLNQSTGTVNVAGGTLAVTNSTGTAVLNVGPVGQGTFLLSNGIAWVDNLVATNGANSVVNFVGGTLDTHATTVSNGAQFVVGNGSAAAAYNLRGGTHSFGNGLQISANSILSVTNANATIAAAAVTNLGTVSVMNGRATFNGNVVNLGAWVSDPSTNTFNGNYTVGPTATVVAAAGDVYAFGGDFTMQSTNRAFNMSTAVAYFGTNGYGLATTTTNHTLNLAGSGALDLGSNFIDHTQLATNFSLGTLAIALNNRLTLTGGVANALYAGVLDLSAWSTNASALTNTLQAALSLDINLYYDKFAANNAYLQGAQFNLWGGSGLLIPIPEPSTAALFALLAGVAALRSFRRRDG